MTAHSTCCKLSCVPSGLLRTTWSDENELPYRNMTAIEMARELGYTQLFDTLAPTIYHCLPNHVLETLQNHFHYLIKIQLHSWPHEYATIRLPELSVLTELKMPLMWFPLKSRVARVPRVSIDLAQPEVDELGCVLEADISSLGFHVPAGRQRIAGQGFSNTC